MTLDEFVEKWSPIKEPHLVELFRNDLLSINEPFEMLPTKRVAIEVLTSITGAELAVEVGEDEGTIRFGAKGDPANAFELYFKPSIGHTNEDWFDLLRILVENSMAKMTKKKNDE